MIRYFSYIVMLFSFLSCGSSSRLLEDNVDIERRGVDESGILFITLHFKSKKSKSVLTQLDAVLVDGNIKQSSVTKGNHLCILEQSNGRIDSILFENPFHAHIEEYNEDGTIRTIEGQREKGETLIRTNYSGGTCAIKIISLFPKPQLLNIFTIQ